MSTATTSTTRSRTTIDYDPEEDCFRDHRGPPYRFQDHIRRLRRTAVPTQPDCLVEQPGLIATQLPRPKIIFEPNTKHEDYQVPIDPPVSAYSVFPFLGQTKHLRFPSESLDLGYDTKGELEQYLHDVQCAKSCNILTTWLPLARVNIENDEGLEFPSTVLRWQALALRKLEADEMPVLSENTTHGQDFTTKPCTPSQLREIFSLGTYSRTYPEPVSPPISPISEPYEPFVPDPDVSIIDLTSEPSSPINENIEKMELGVEDDRLDSDPASPSCIFGPPPTARAAFLGTKSSKLSELKLDLPLLSSSPGSSSKSDHMIATLTPSAIDPEASFQATVEQGGFFEEAFQTFLDSRHHEANQLLEQERPNPANTLLRLPIPVLDFDIPVPEWSAHLSSSKDHFSWLAQTLSSAFHLPCFEGLSSLNSSLKWTPIPPGSGRVSLTEAAVQLSPLSKELLSLQPSQLCSRDYVVLRSRPMVLKFLHDEDIELELENDSAISHSVQEESHTISAPVNKAHEPVRTQSLDDLLGAKRQSLRVRADSKGKKRLLIDGSSTGASSLLSNFIQLRQPKKLKTRGDTPPPTSQLTSKSQATTTSARSVTREVQREPKEAPSPVLSIPTGDYRYIVSMELSRKVLSFIEKSWPHVELVDRDFTQYNEVSWSPGSTQRNKVVSPLAFEADISLCPAAGLIMTTILRVKQKSLPGSTALSALRERVKLVSQKYEYLFILVSETNPQGEYVGSPTASDLAGYADFVRFTTGLQAGISTFLVSGAEETLAKWALSIMSQYSSAANQFGQFLDFRDGEWSMFFRRAGLNICAAQVMAELLWSEYGQFGLTNFLKMRANDRVSKYGQILGGSRIMGNVSGILDQEWF
ncbi:uncharacterized protein FIESC28_06310 [Fusarium coffeatum]|uniref:Uncharacterized protein n=1 Tax=Fusarium coffeatum TaxID=231269 RepID=A0A366RL57_9HYPO|nr:uncharacterized protein FIESC28_06310 [Fusarium coffeatum]RBR17871.1 hypothetical protein FIESC28_06310 [Fusarium coffeatum]